MLLLGIDGDEVSQAVDWTPDREGTAVWRHVWDSGWIISNTEFGLFAEQSKIFLPLMIK